MSSLGKFGTLVGRDGSKEECSVEFVGGDSYSGKDCAPGVEFDVEERGSRCFECLVRRGLTFL